MTTLGLNRPSKAGSYTKPTLESIKKLREGNTLEDQDESGKLNVSGMEQGYYYHVANEGQKLDKLLRRGYEVVQNDGTIKMGDSNPEEIGTNVQATRDKEEGTKAVLTRIPQEFKDEDDAYRQSKVDKTEEALYKNEENMTDEHGKARYGKISKGG